MSGVCFAGVEEGGAHCIEASVRRVSSKVFHAQCVPDYHHRCPPAGPRQENKPSQPPVAPDDSTPCRAKFGEVSERFAGIENCYTQPIDSYSGSALAHQDCDSKFGGWFGAKGAGVRPKKKALQILHL